MCLNEKDFMIWGDYSQHDKFFKKSIYTCNDGYICDESNSNVCTSTYYTNKANIGDENKNLKLLARLASLTDNELQDYDDYLSNLLEKITKQEKDVALDNYKTVRTPDVNYSNRKEFELFPDRSNPRMYWYFNKTPSGALELIPMFCNKHQLYDENISSCRNMGELNNPKLSTYASDVSQLQSKRLSDLGTSEIKSQVVTQPFICDINVGSNKLIADNDCRLYHICFEKRNSPLREITYICPEKTAFDPQFQKCTTNAVKYCKPEVKWYTTKSKKDAILFSGIQNPINL